MKLGGRRPVVVQRLGELERDLPRLERGRDAIDAAITADKAEIVKLTAERPRHEHPLDEDARTGRLRELNDRVNVCTLGPRDRWERQGVLVPIALAAGLTPPPGETDPSAGLVGLNRMNRRIAELQRERAELVAELAAIDAPVATAG